MNISKIFLKEKLGKDADAGDYIDDFMKSDAPQFKGKSKEKKRDMAIAAYLDAKDKNEEVGSISFNYIEKDINNNTIVYPETDGSKPRRLKKRSFKRSMYGLNKRPKGFSKRKTS